MLTKFEYPITRVYPYKWFPWAVYIGGLCAFVLFSLLNFAANGYILTVLYTSDYNGTIATRTWSEKLSFNDRIVASCESQNLPVHSQFYTDKLALVYDLENIWLEGDEQTRAKTLPNLQYANNPLRNCSIPLLQLDMNFDDGRNAAQIGWTPWGLSAFVSGPTSSLEERIIMKCSGKGDVLNRQRENDEDQSHDQVRVCEFDH